MRHAAALIALALCCAACVTEKPSRGGVPVRPGGPRSSSSQQVAELPAGPIAAPAQSATTAARVQATIVPLGVLSFDAQTLPLTSPDGRFIAVQQGEAPDWAAILAEDGAQAPLRSTLAAYEVTPDRALRPIPPGQPLPAGSLLGRAADTTGFLIESMQSDGSRWIGKASWAAGEVTWLVIDASINAHALLTLDGGLLFTRRAAGSGPADLVYRAPSGSESTLPAGDGSWSYPIPSPDPEVVYALRHTPSALELAAVRLNAGSGLGGVITSRRLCGPTDEVTAHQVASPAAPIARAAPGARAILAHPTLERMAAFDLSTASFLPLAPQSIAAVHGRSASIPGYYCTTPEGLVFFPESPMPHAPGGVKVLGSPYVPRPVAAPGPDQFVLFGPVRNRPDRLEVTRLILGEPGTGAR